MNERLPRQSKSARDGSITRFHPPQVRIVALQGLIVLLATALAGLRVVLAGIAAWWLFPLALILYGLLLAIDVSVEVSSTEIAIWPWLGQLVHFSWQHRYPLWALVDIQRLRYGSLRLIFVAGGREHKIVLWSLGFPPRHIPALVRAIQANRASL